MLGGSSTAAATLSTNTSAATSFSTPPSRPSRLRGLSYLRNYTHSHLHSNTTTPSRSNNPAPLSRTKSSPVGRVTARPEPTSPTSTPSRNYPTPSPQRDTVAGNHTTGWLPTAGGTDDPSRSASRSQAAPVAPSSVEAVTPPVTMGLERTPTQTLSGRSVSTPNTITVNNGDTPSATMDKNMPSIRLIPHNEPRASRPSLGFPIVNRQLTAPDAIVKVGRYSERDHSATDAYTNPLSNAPVGFKSKVVSRRHCEFWYSNNQWFVKDVKSSSGTFLNHVRLSSPGQESRPFPVNDGDIVQLGIDFKGGEEIIFRCVKIRVECNRGWQKGPNPFNTSTHKRLKNLGKLRKSPSRDSDAQSVNSSECAICLNPVAPCQALFVAPCSHVWHYKCIRNIIYPKWPSFQCPNCRAYADLDADVEPPENDDSDEEFQDALAASKSQAREDATHANLGAEQDSAMNGHDAASDGPEDASINPSTAATSEPIATPNASRAASTRSIIASTSAPVNGRTERVQEVEVQTGVPDGPATPRNDAGPFVLESAPRSSIRRSREVDDIARETVREESKERDEDVEMS